MTQSWQRLARHYAKKYGVSNPYAFQRQMGQEAHGEDLTSPAGALGPAQIMPATAAAWGVKNPHDINQAYDAAAKHMADYEKQYGSLKDALVAYNAGPGRVGKSLPVETQNYIKTIIGNHGSSSAPHASNVSSIASTPSSVLGSTQATSQEPSVYDVITRYRDATTPQTPTPGTSLLSSPYDPVASGQQIQGTVERIKALRAPAQQALQTGDAVGSGIAADKDAPAAVAQLIEAADKIDSKRYPYVWGGGHAASGKADRGTGRDPGIGLDCSGAVSAVLGINPRVSGDFERWGEGGEGRHVTVYANGEHVLMKINGHFFGTSSSNPEGGAGWIPQKAVSKEYLSRFTKRHPKGM